MKKLIILIFITLLTTGCAAKNDLAEAELIRQQANLVSAINNQDTGELAVADKAMELLVDLEGMVAKRDRADVAVYVQMIDSVKAESAMKTVIIYILIAIIVALAIAYIRKPSVIPNAQTIPYTGSTELRTIHDNAYMFDGRRIVLPDDVISTLQYLASRGTAL